MGRGNARIFNVISLIFLALSIVWIVFVVSRLLAPPPAIDEVVDLPTPMVLPTLPPTNTPVPTSTPTETLTPTITPSPSATVTETIAPTASATITDTPGPTPTPSDTPTLPFTFTPTPSETPAEPTPTIPPPPPPFPFDLRNNEVMFLANFANTAGCAWQGIAGQVFDMAGNPLTIPLRIHVFGGPDNLDRYVDTGSNSNYGAAGWEQPLGNTVNSGVYFVQLESTGGTPISDVVQVSFASDCQRNLALVNFIQNRPL